MSPADLKSSDIILPEAIRERPAAARWRRPFVLSILAHALLAGLGWSLFATGTVPVPPEPVVKSNLVEEEDYPVGVLDVDVPLCPHPPALPQLPRVIIPPTEAVPPQIATQPVSKPETSHVPSAEPKGPNGATGGASPPSPVSAVAGQSSGSSGNATTFFQVPAQGHSVVYVIDRSASMGPDGRFDLARREVLASLARLPESARFQIIAYNKHVESVQINGHGGLLPATAENKHLAALFLQALAAEGSTDHWPALSQAMLLTPDVVYFLTDADDLKPEQVRALTDLNKGRSAIHAIELNTANRERRDLPMHALPRLNHGQYQAVDVLQLR